MNEGSILIIDFLKITILLQSEPNLVNKFFHNIIFF